VSRQERENRRSGARHGVGRLLFGAAVLRSRSWPTDRSRHSMAAIHDHAFFHPTSASRGRPVDRGLYIRSLLTRLARRVSPGPNHPLRTCRSLYPEGTRPWACPERQSVGCRLRRDMLLSQTARGAHGAKRATAGSGRKCFPSSPRCEPRPSKRHHSVTGDADWLIAIEGPLHRALERAIAVVGDHALNPDKKGSPRLSVGEHVLGHDRSNGSVTVIPPQQR
jgi:hypothetical protein